MQSASTTVPTFYTRLMIYLQQKKALMTVCWSGYRYCTKWLCAIFKLSFTDLALTEHSYLTPFVDFLQPSKDLKAMSLLLSKTAAQRRCRFWEAWVPTVEHPHHTEHCQQRLSMACVSFLWEHPCRSRRLFLSRRRSGPGSASASELPSGFAQPPGS